MFLFFEFFLVLATDYWNNFFKTGDPNGPTVPKWPAAETMDVMYIDWNCRVLSGQDPIDQLLVEGFIEKNDLGAYFE